MERERLHLTLDALSRPPHFPLSTLAIPLKPCAHGLDELAAARTRQLVLHREGRAGAAHPQEARTRRGENERG